MTHKHSRLTNAGRLVWFVERLWYLTRDLPSYDLPIDQLAEFDQDCWFGTTALPTCRAIAEHARRIVAADLHYPIILAADGSLMDGGHRIAKAYLLHQQTIRAVRFPADPEPDYILSVGAPLPNVPRIAIPTSNDPSSCTS